MGEWDSVLEYWGLYETNKNILIQSFGILQKFDLFLSKVIIWVNIFQAIAL